MADGFDNTPHPGDINQASLRKAAPRNLETPTAQPSATGQTTTAIPQTATQRLLPSPDQVSGARTVSGAPTGTFYGAPGQAPGATLPPNGIQPDPIAAANRQAEFAANRAGPAASAAAPEVGALGKAAAMSAAQRLRMLSSSAGGIVAAAPAAAWAAHDLLHGDPVHAAGNATDAATLFSAARTPGFAASAKLLGGGLTAAELLKQAPTVAGTPTENYVQRGVPDAGLGADIGVHRAFGNGPIATGVGNAAHLLGDAGTRAAGALTDVGAGLINSVVPGYRDRFADVHGGTGGGPAAGATAAGAPTDKRPDASPATAAPLVDPTAGQTEGTAKRQLTAAEALRSNAQGTAVINGKVMSQQDIADAGKRVNVIPHENFTHPALGAGQNVTDAQGQAIADRAAGRNPDVGFAVPSFGSHGIGAPTTVDQRGGGLVDQIKSLASASGVGASGKRRSARALIDMLGQLGNQQRTQLEFSTPRPQSAAETELLQSQAAEQRQRGQFYGSEANKRDNIAALQDQLMSTNDPGERQILENKLAASSGKVTPGARGDVYHNVKLPDGSELPVRERDLPEVYKRLMTFGQPQAQQ